LILDDTIAAIASAPGGAFRGILRLSGPDVVACLQRCFRPAGGVMLTDSRRAGVLSGDLLVAPPIGALPCDLYLWPTARSYTRQLAAELHTFGSPPLLDAALRTVCQAGARLAAPGEFTFRAFLAGRLDLTQAEAVLGVIDAHDRRELEVALAQLAGGLAQPLNELRQRLLDLLAHVEAGLDFAGEDLPLITPAELDRQLAEAAQAVGRLADQMRSRGEAAEAFRVVISGYPNVGKSSLFNALTGAAAALVSDVAGTTRDYVARRMDLAGVPCLLIDTAGLAASAEAGIAGAAQRMTTEQVAQAHLQLFCLDATRRLNPWERARLTTAAPEGRLLVLTKTDGPRATDVHLPALETSSRTGAGLAALRDAIARCGMESLGRDSAVVAGTAVRCRESLRLAADALAQARSAGAHGIGEEVVAAELRLALDELGEVLGAVYTEDVLDRIFSRFCIGK
jgi:tRNA modification GTPase